MGTQVHLSVVGRTQATAEEALMHAFQVIRQVESCCSRFDRTSELAQLCRVVGQPVAVSDILFEAVRFAVEVAALTQGHFDPTVGRAMELAGFNQHYLTAERVNTELGEGEQVSYRDVRVDEEARTVCLTKPMVLDIGAVAKGLGVDLAAQVLRSYAFQGFTIDAGGDLYVAGTNARDEPWRVGIRHPVHREESILTLRLTDAAVCTSGSYERISPVHAGTHHILDPVAHQSPKELVSLTAIGSFAMMADAFSTAGFVLGWEQGRALLASVDLEAVAITNQLAVHMTPGVEGYVWENTIDR
ncbi:FAD:protein FMN transferase [Alicyclobacillus cycloheptanicus]|uniref:FAD:protein FMN transferase n=1 Tax=Alicyclobacillus cycloheptanicus TaxID=1457 RepID=A0ABT9XH18_9BACL|nr:FAD:protein FMN transferase [Alicyclobacillus cycloheptanicus]MDQ0189597.1 thiamine biosynthesis lipoprotein [Alicyclobacillus cycloheptanicus]